MAQQILCYIFLPDCSSAVIHVLPELNLGISVSRFGCITIVVPYGSLGTKSSPRTGFICHNSHVKPLNIVYVRHSMMRAQSIGRVISHIILFVHFGPIFFFMVRETRICNTGVCYLCYLLMLLRYEIYVLIKVDFGFIFVPSITRHQPRNSGILWVILASMHWSCQVEH